MRIERAQAVGQFFRQHRNHPAREIHRVAAQQRFPIQRIVAVYVVAHVGNRHHQAEARSDRFAIHRVVKVARGFAVNCHQRQMADVLAPGPIGFGHGGGIGLRLLFRRVRKFMRQIVLAQGNFDFHAGVGVVAQHLHDVTNRLGMLVGLLQDFQNHHLPGLGPAGVTGGDQNVLADAAIFCHHKQNAMLGKQSPDHALVGALQHFHDFAFRATTSIDAALPHQRHVAVQHLVHFFFAQENIGTAIVRQQKAEPIGMALHLALNQIQLFHDANGALAVAHDLPVALHGSQAAAEQVFLIRLDVEQLQQFIFIHGRAALGQHLQQELAAGQGMLVLITFAGQVRVLRA